MRDDGLFSEWIRFCASGPCVQRIGAKIANSTSSASTSTGTASLRSASTERVEVITRSEADARAGSSGACGRVASSSAPSRGDPSLIGAILLPFDLCFARSVYYCRSDERARAVAGKPREAVVVRQAARRVHSAMSDPAILTCAVAGGIVTGNPNQPRPRRRDRGRRSARRAPARASSTSTRERPTAR